MKELLKEHTAQLFIFLAAFLAPIEPIIVLMVFLAFMDLFTAVWAARKCKIAITSRKLSKTITKIILFTIAVTCSHGVETVFSALQYINLTNLTSGYICLVELKSIYENISKVTGLDLWKYLLKKVDSLREETGEKEK